MIALNNYIKEAFKLTADTKINKMPEYNYQPKTQEELQDLVAKLIEERGDDADLNDINTSKITDMSFIFSSSLFNGDISNWDVSNVEDMRYMFADSAFNGDISNWDVSKVENMYYMFAHSKFNGDISNWDVSNVKDIRSVFKDSPLESQPQKCPKFNK
jgi:surface protein